MLLFFSDIFLLYSENTTNIGIPNSGSSITQTHNDTYIIIE